MATKLGDFIFNLAKQAGLPEDSDAVKSLIAIPELTKIEVPDEVATGINSGLLTMEAARNNEALKTHYHGLFHAGAEAHIKRLASDLGLPEDFTTEVIGKERSTWNRYSALAKKVEELTAAKAGASKGDKKEFEDEITKLNAQMKAIREEAEKKVSERDNYWVGRLQNIELEKMLSGYEYASSQPKEVNIELAKLLLNRKLQEDKFIQVYDDQRNALSLKTESGMQAFGKDNSPLSVEGYIKSVLDSNNLLKKSDPAKVTKTQTTGSQAGQGTNMGSDFQAAIAQSLADVEK